MNDIFRREWGAVLFVLTVLIGAVAVAVSLVVTGAHEPPVPTLPPCPSYTPYVTTPTPSATPTPSPTPSPSASASVTATPLPGQSTATASATPIPFNPALANCPTAPARPPSTPTPSGATGSAAPKPATPPPTAAPSTNPFPTLSASPTSS